MKNFGNHQFNAANQIASIYHDTGVADAYAVAMRPIIERYTEGLLVRFEALNASTGPSTLNVNGLGPKRIVKAVSADLGVNDIVVGQIVTVVYDGVNFQWVGATFESGVTRLVFGGVVTWLGNYDYHISAAGYFINGQYYTSPAVDVTLDPPDPTLDRIDTFVVNTNSQAVVLTGTPSSNPAEPPLDIAFQLRLSAALVKVGTTSPNITTECLWLENTEWTTTTNAPARILLSDISNPFQGIRDIHANSPINNDYILFTRPAGSFVPVQLGFTQLTFELEPKNGWTQLTKRIRIQWENAGTVVGNAVTVQNGSYGFSSLVGNYQLLAIPLTEFGLSRTSVVTSLRMIVQLTSGSWQGFYLDKICLQGQEVTPPGSPNGTSGTSGTAGSSGTSGFNGSSGTSAAASGTSGSSGTSATSGTAAGTSGTSGTSGGTGASGTSGTSGATGANGTSGTSGTAGTSGTGVAGSSGTSGLDGATTGTSGTSGSSGTSAATSGTAGSAGSSGTSGQNGTSGVNGANGSSGTSGNSGTSGTSSSSGTSGINGADGIDGLDGNNGTSGTSGTSGAVGAAGSSGTSGTGLPFNVQDEGIDLTQRPKINFIGSAVTATDNPTTGVTDVTITGGISGITADNGLTANTSTNVQWGGTLLHDTFITGGSFVSTISSSVTGGSSYSLTAANSSSGGAFLGQSSTGAAVTGSATSSGIGVTASSVTGTALFANVNPSTTNVSATIATFRRNTSGIADNGIGVEIDFEIETASGSAALANEIVSRWANATNSSRTSIMELWGVNSATTLKKASLDSASGFTIYSPQTQPTTSAELNTSPDTWTTGGSATFVSAGQYKIASAGASGTISTTLPTPTIGDVYVVTMAIGSVAPISVTFAGVTTPASNQRVFSSAGSTDYYQFHIVAASTSATMTINFTALGANATVQNISIKKITAATPIAFAHNTDNGSNEWEVRSDNNTRNLSIGLNSGRYNINNSYATATNFGMDNVFMGHTAGAANTVGAENVFIGSFAGAVSTSSFGSVAIGYRALASAVLSDGNIAIGDLALQAHNPNSSYTGANIAIGYGNQRTNTTGIGNTSIGTFAMQSLTTGSYNVSVGEFSMGNGGTVTGSFNVGIGYNAIGAVTNGISNVALGPSTAGGITTGSRNVIIGSDSGYYITTGSYITSIGGYTLGTISTNNQLEVTQTGVRGNANDGHLIYLGSYAWKGTATDVSTVNSVAIGYDSRIYQSNQVVLGGNDITSTFLKGAVEIRDFSGLASNTLADPAFPAATTKWSVTGAAMSLTTGAAVFNLNNGTSGTLVQTQANMAIAGKGSRWYKLVFNASFGNITTGSPPTVNVSITGSTFASTTLELFQANQNTTSGAQTVKLYFKATSAPTDITFSFSGTAGTDTSRNVFSVTSIVLTEVTGGDLFVNRDLEVYRNIKATNMPVYANDAAADADSALPSGSFYKLTGNRTVFQKP